MVGCDCFHIFLSFGFIFVFIVFTGPERLISEVERHTYYQFPVTYRTNRITQAMLLIG